MADRWITCPDCNGAGCSNCTDGKVKAAGHGGKLIAISEDTETAVLALIDIVSDIKDKVNDIFEKVNE